MTTDTITNVVDTYINAWNERVPERRRALVAAAFADGATYVDPARSGTGADGIDTMISSAQEEHPGVQIVLAGTPDAHGEHVRFTWHLLPPASEDIILIGHDFASLSPDGRLQDVVGFVEPPTA